IARDRRAEAVADEDEAPEPELVRDRADVPRECGDRVLTGARRLGAAVAAEIHRDRAPPATRDVGELRAPERRVAREAVDEDHGLRVGAAEVDHVQESDRTADPALARRGRGLLAQIGHGAPPSAETLAARVPQSPGGRHASYLATRSLRTRSGQPEG